MDSTSPDVDEFGVGPVFTEYGDHLVKESEIRDQIRTSVREIEETLRQMYTHLQKVHRPGGVKNLTVIVSGVEAKFGQLQGLYKNLDEKVPEGSYWRYNNIWQSTNNWAAFLIAFTSYLKDEKLASQAQVSQMAGLTGLKTLQLDIEEYLVGLCQMSNELSRLAVNSVTSEDYGKPLRIADFLNSLNSGFRMLNLKNDNLRKKFDSIKYDLKKVEEVVYDISLRGLAKPKEDEATAPEAESKEAAAEPASAE